MPKARIFAKAIVPLLAALALLAAGCGARAKPEAGGTKPAAGTPSAAATGKASAPAASATPAKAPVASPTEAPKGLLKDGWIAGIPDYVPRFPAGSIDKTQSRIEEGSTSTVFLLCIRDVQRSDVEAYTQTLKDNGYDAAGATIGNTYTVTASMDLGYGTVTLVITLTSDGIAVYTLGAPV